MAGGGAAATWGGGAVAAGGGGGCGAQAAKVNNKPSTTRRCIPCSQVELPPLTVSGEPCFVLAQSTHPAERRSRLKARRMSHCQHATFAGSVAAAAALIGRRGRPGSAAAQDAFQENGQTFRGAVARTQHR